MPGPLIVDGKRLVLRRLTPELRELVQAAVACQSAYRESSVELLTMSLDDDLDPEVRANCQARGLELGEEAADVLYRLFAVLLVSADGSPLNAAHLAAHLELDQLLEALAVH